jgi:hypothetical protein
MTKVAAGLDTRCATKSILSSKWSSAGLGEPQGTTKEWSGKSWWFSISLSIFHKYCKKQNITRTF